MCKRNPFIKGSFDVLQRCHGKISPSVLHIHHLCCLKETRNRFIEKYCPDEVLGCLLSLTSARVRIQLVVYEEVASNFGLGGGFRHH